MNRLIEMGLKKTGLQQMRLKQTGFILLLATLVSCSDGSSNNFKSDDVARAVVATAAADFSSGAHSVISQDDTGALSALNELQPTGSDITIASYGSHFYRIGRAFSGNSITKFSVTDPQTPIWQYSTEDGGAVSSDPHDMVFVSETKAYVLRYGSSVMWIVNPSATTEAEFKIGEIDLSAYDSTDTIPEMDAGVIVGDRLYIILQRLDNFAVTQESYVAIFDVNTDKEIDAQVSGGGLKGIPIQTRNLTNIVYEPTSNMIFVQGSGSFFPVEYTSGIEKIDLADFSTSLVLDDGTAANHPFGLITELAVVSETLLYFVGYDGFTDNTLYKMDLLSGDITATAVPSLLNGQISHLTVDDEGLLWVSDSVNATVRVIDPLTDTEVEAIFTSLNPIKVVFTD
jgi:hypothetical protein